MCIKYANNFRGPQKCAQIAIFGTIWQPWLWYRPTFVNNFRAGKLIRAIMIIIKAIDAKLEIPDGI
jgi:hypothetical protein